MNTDTVAVNKRLSRVLVAPHITEKTERSGANENSVTFWVLPSATKDEIKAAVEHFFKVTVAKVSTVTKRGGEVRFGARIGRRKDKKKAYVKLAAGSEIKFQVE